MKNNVNFDEKQNVLEVSLEQLRETSGLSDYNGKLDKKRPVEHYKLIDDLSDIMNRNNLVPKYEPIYVSKSDSKRIMALDPAKEGLLPSWLFQRLVTRIGVESLGDDKTHTAIAIAYNINGISLSWGQNVRVCQNMNIFGNHTMCTYGNSSGKVQEYEKILQIFNEWCLGAEQKRAFDLEIYRKMQEITLNKKEEIRAFIGDMHLEAVKTAYINPKFDAPLNIGQLSEYSREYLKEYGTQDSNSDILEQDQFVTLYNLYQLGTSILSPSKTDIVKIWDDIRAFGNNLINKFGIS